MSRRPSSLPLLAQCQCFDGKGSDFADQGTARHKALAKLVMSNDPLQLAGMDEDDRDGIEWAAEYIRVKAPMLDHPIVAEHKVNPLTAEFEPIFPNGGTLDFGCGPEVFDFKWRQRDYKPQMAAYALGWIQESGHEVVRTHILFGESQWSEVFEWTEASALEEVNRVLALCSPDAKPTPCDYCGWCAKAVTCPALIERANGVVAGREDWTLETFHSSEISTADEMGKALRLAGPLADWCEAVKHHAKELAIKQGIVATGFKIQTRQGNRFIPSVGDAFARMAMPQPEFLRVCEVKFARLVEVIAELNGLKKAQAERDVERKLADAIQRKPSTVSLVKLKE